jgi:hypothetical protein
MGDIFNEIWHNLGTLSTWREVIGWVVLLATTFVPVMVLWGADRIRPDEPLVPVFLAVSILGGAVGMPLMYPKKGYWLPGVIAGPFFGPGVFLAFWLLAGAVMNKLIFAVVVLLGATPSFGLYLFLLYRRARRGEATE